MAMEIEEVPAAPMGFHCSLCYNWYEPHLTRTLLYANGKPMGEICPDCLEAGPQGAAKRVRAFAEELRMIAEELRSRAENAEALARGIEQVPQDQWPGGETSWKARDRLERFFTAYRKYPWDRNPKTEQWRRERRTRWR